MQYPKLRGPELIRLARGIRSSCTRW